MTETRGMTETDQLVVTPVHSRFELADRFSVSRDPENALAGRSTQCQDAISEKGENDGDLEIRV